MLRSLALVCLTLASSQAFAQRVFLTFDDSANLQPYNFQYYCGEDLPCYTSRSTGEWDVNFADVEKCWRWEVGNQGFSRITSYTMSTCRNGKNCVKFTSFGPAGARFASEGGQKCPVGNDQGVFLGR